MTQGEVHIFQGMSRDTHQIRQDSKFLWDAHNIRLTNREDNTSLAITNERGTLNTGVTFLGYYVGHCVLGKYLVVFTSNDDSSDTYIYRVEKTEEGFRSVILFYESNGWKEAWVPTHPIETIGVYETNYVQKVYWVDGLNQPRVINIAKPEYIITGTKYEALLSLPSVNFSEQGLTLENPGIINPDTRNPYTDEEWNSFKQGYDAEIGPIYTKESFDFCRKLQLGELVSVYRGEGNGMFSPGTIQYALSYFNKYEQETNIFYTTPLNYISPIGRGGSPEEKVSNFFTIDIKELDPNFDYLRIYSIHRTSIDATPEVKLVEDVLIKDINSIQFVDDGTKGTIIDPTQLLYIGGTELIAGCIAHKDGTLFLGNLQLKPDNIFEDIILEDWNFSEPYITPSIDTVNTDSTYYNYTSSLGSKYSAGFQSGETYRCGIQVQTEDGKWSTPIFLGDTVLNNSIITTGRTRETLAVELNDKDICKTLYNAGGRKIRACVVFPRPYERNVICQGILCPTVYSASGRHSGSIYAMSSWFFRPAIGKANDPKSIYQGALIQYRHNKPLFSAASRGAEIQNMIDSTIDNVSSIDSASYDKYKSYYFVDENIVTFHSPDIEFDTNLQNLDWSNTKLQIVGKANLGAISGDININTSTPAAGVKNVLGFNHVPVGYQTNNLIKVNGGLVSGLFYDSALIKNDYEVAGNKGFMVYPWHRSGSLNNDTNRPTDKGTKSAALSTKVISNLKFFPDNSALPVLEGDTEHGGTIFNYSISTPKLFNAEELILTKLSPSYLTRDVPYMGNMDTLSTSSEPYPFYVGKESEKFDTDIVKLESDSTTTYIDSSSDPVRIKYKSSPHLVFSLLDSSDKIRILPRHASITESLPNYTVPEWQDSGTGERRDGYDGTIYGIGTKSIGGISWLGVGDNEGQYILDFPEKALMSKCYQIYKDVNGHAALKNVEKPEGLILKVLKGHTFLPYDNDTLQTIFPGMNVDDVKDNVYEGSSLYYKIVKDEQSTTTKTYYKLEQATLSTTSNTTYTIDQDTFGSSTDSTAPYLLVANLIREVPADVMFGGTSKEALQQNLWIPASDPIIIPASGSGLSIPYEYGDTWYQRYDCLKTYPFTKEDENQIVEIGSFMCETRVNIDGRYDKNRGQYSNLSMTPQNFNLLNEVYTQKDNFFNYRILDEDYYKQHKYPNQITWSKEKHAGEDVDTWTNITLASTLDMNGELGEVTSIKAWNEFLICFQEDAVNQILFNSRAQIPTTDGVPIEISNGYKVDGSRALSTKVGCSNKWSIAISPMGVYFIDSNTDSLYLFNGQLANLSGSKKMDWWFKEPYADKIWGPMQKNNNGVRTFYDRVWEDIYFVPGDSETQPDALCYSEKLGQFTSLMSYGGTQAMFNYMDEFYSLRGDSEGTKVMLYQNFAGSYNNIFDKLVGWDFSFIANDNPIYTKVFDTTEMRADIFSSDGMLLNTCPITDIEVSNEYQQGSAIINSTNMRKKFRIWRGLLPRNKNTRQRIRNPWAQITLKWDPSKQENKNTRAIVHDISVKYTI